MPDQYKRELLSNEEADKLSNTAESFSEKLVIFTLLDTGLRVAELVGKATHHLRKEIQTASRSDYNTGTACVGKPLRH